jgi:hypothetical protein
MQGLQLVIGLVARLWGRCWHPPGVYGPPRLAGSVQAGCLLRVNPHGGRAAPAGRASYGKSTGESDTDPQCLSDTSRVSPTERL